MTAQVQAIFAVLQEHSGRIIAETIIESYQRRVQRSADSGVDMRPNARLKALQHSIKLFVAAEQEQQKCISEIEKLLNLGDQANPSIQTISRSTQEKSLQNESAQSEKQAAHISSHTLKAEEEFEVEIQRESDIVVARHRVRSLCMDLGADRLLQTKVTTVVSEMARNIFQYAGRGFMRFRLTRNGRAALRIMARDYGPGISNLDVILAGEYRSKTGMGKGILSMRTIMDEFDIRSGPEIGTEIKCTKYMG